MESFAQMSNAHQLDRVESNDTAVGSGIFVNPKYEVGETTMNTETSFSGDDFNLQLTKDNYGYDSSVNNDLTGNTMTSEASAGAAKSTGTGTFTGSNTADTTVFEDYLDLEAMQLQQQQQVQLRQMQLQLQQHQLKQQQQWQQQQQQQRQQPFLPIPPRRDSSRRLSISDYDVDNAGYYEYEYFGKPGLQIGNSTSDDDNDVHLNDSSNDEVMNEPFTDLSFKVSAGSTTTNNNDGNNINFLQDEAIMMSDEDWGTPRDESAIQMGTNNDLFDFVPQTQSLEVPMAEEYNFDVDAPLIEPQQPPKKKVKDYFKLNFFTNNNNSNNTNTNSSTGNNGSTDFMIGDEPVFKKKYFWNKNPIKRRVRQDDPFEMEEDHALVNPSQLIASSNECDDEDGHTVSESLAVFDNLEEKEISAAMVDQAPAPVAELGAVQPIIPMAATPTIINDPNTDDVDNYAHINTTGSSTPSPQPLSRKRLGSMPKTRGRKPSPIPDATKHFGCEYCDRRFKRQEHLKRHIRSLHMCEKPFGCHICGKKFSRSDNLNQHIKTHSHQ